MANRYWVGGSASWDGTAGTKWSTTAGGAGGASVPTTADDVFFVSGSSGIVTIANGNTGAKSINCSTFTGEIAGSANITVAGSVTLNSSMTYTHTGTITFTGTGTLTTAGKNFSGVTVNGSGITLTLGDALSMAAARSITVTQGTFSTANFSVSCGNLISTGTSTRTINLGSSTVTVATNLTFDATNLTVNAGTSLIRMSSNSAIFAGGDKPFYNVTFTGVSVGTRSITGANSFNNLTLGTGSAGLTQLSLAADQTVSGSLTVAGSITVRGFIRSNTMGATRTITAAAVSINDCDFRDITLAGAAAGSSILRGGDCGGNSGITFPAAKTVYRVGTNTTWAGSSSWATSSGGTGSNNNFPLPQDTAVINNATTLSGTLSLALYNIGSLDASSRTNAMTLSNTAGCDFYGSFTLGSGVTFSGTAGIGFSGRGTMVFTSAGKTITGPIIIDTPTGTLQLGSAFTSSSTSGSPGPIQLTRGTFDAATYNVTTPRFRSDNSNIRTLLMGSGLWTLTGTGTGSTSIWNVGSTNLTVNKGTADILLSNTTTSNRQMWMGDGLSFNKLTIGGATGTSELYLFGSDFSFTELASTKTVAHTVMFSGNLGTIGTWSISGSAGNVVTVKSSSPGTRRTFTLTNPTTSSIDYLNITDIGVTDPDEFYVGANSTDGGNNLNVIFTIAPILLAYWVGGTAFWDASDASVWASTSGGVGGAGVPTTATNVVFDANSNVGTGAFTVTCSSAACKNLTISGLDGTMTLTSSGGGFNNLSVAGSITFPSTNFNPNISINLVADTSVTLDTKGLTIGSSLFFNGSGSWTLLSNLTINSGADFQHQNGTINLNGFQVSTGRWNNGAVAFGNRTLTFSGGSITLNNSSAGPDTGFSISTPSTYTITDTGTITVAGSTVGTKNITAPSATVGIEKINWVVNTPNSFTTVNFGTSVVGNLTINNISATVSGTSLTVYGNFLVSSTSPTVNITTITFAGTSGTKTITTNGETLGSSLVFNGAGSTWQLVDNLTTSATTSTTLTSGTLDLNGKTLSTGTFASSNSNTRTLTSATPATISCTSPSTGFTWNTGTVTNFTGSNNITVSIIGDDTATKIISPGTLPEASTFNFTIGGNGTSLTWSGAATVNNLTFTNTTSTTTFGSTLSIFGNLNIQGTSPTISLNSSNGWTFASTSGTKTITTSGQQILRSVTFDGVGGTWQLLDGFTLDSGRTLTLTNGTLNLNGQILDVGASFTTAAGTKNITFNGGTLLCSVASSTAFNNAAPTNFTTTAGTGVGKISMAGGSSAKTFVGGGSTYNCTLENAGSGALTIAGSNTFTNITNSVSPTTFTFTADTTTTVTDFAVSGTVGNIVTINSTGAPFTLSKTAGTVNVSYTNISNSLATGGAVWNALLSSGNTDGGGNTGWTFALLSSGNILLIF